MRTPPAILWFRRDLRLTDNPALNAATQTGAPLIPVFILSPNDPAGAASRVWLHNSLERLATELHKRHLQLILRKGLPQTVLPDLCRETGARHVFAARLPEPDIVRSENATQTALNEIGVALNWSAPSLLVRPEDLLTKSGTPYKVFTPFYRAFMARREPEPPENAPKGIPSPDTWPRSMPLAELELEPQINWAEGIRSAWTPGEQGAHDTLDRFSEEALEQYEKGRDRPDRIGTSRLSPYLHFGEISARQVWHAIRGVSERADGNAQLARSAEAYLRQIVWREFAHDLLHHFPHTVSEPLYPKFRDFPWRWGGDLLKAWKKGQTGYPIVDAGMRELWETGWMHNRVRMIVASFLVKDLMIHWIEGARWFHDTLVDADLANNTFGWQWTAGCGADAAPFFRIFNPVSQGERHDPEGDYVRRWVPELATLASEWIHHPWDAPADILQRADVRFGDTYPCRIVDHNEARDDALDAYDRIRSNKST